MEAFSLLKYWKGGGGPDPFLSASRAVPTTTILAATAASSPSSSDVDNDDLFDLEFNDDDVAEEEEEEEADAQNVEELGSSASPSLSSNDRATVSPEESDDPASEPDSRPPPPPVLLHKFRVFLVGLKKPKADAQKQEDDDVTRSSSAGSGKLFAVKLKLDEAPFVSLFKSQGQSQTKTKKGIETAPVCEDNRRFSKEGVQRYLKKVKPLYVKVSKRMSTGAGEGPVPAGRVVERQVSLPLRVVYKHLGKSRSGTSLAVSSLVAEEDPAGSAAGAGGVASKRRDDSLLQQQDGIQGAILHCKRSFNASRDSDASPLPRSSIDPTSHERLTELLSRKPSGCNGRGK